MNDVTSNLLPLLPELILAAEGFLLLIVGVYWLPRVTTGFLLAAVLALLPPILLMPSFSAPAVVVMNGMFISDAFSAFAKLLVLTGTGLALLLSQRW
ncbi:MAG: NADH-quinone oxidoreductase subunit N, partial [Alphaproteobacteria bacterium]|nr:NADH-quinone oxidoreductase subunit N [Alphaproteobacteria bacterium]